MTKELVVISGKGGTGKTSLTAAFAVLAERPVIADCDVDAADLDLVLSPRILQRHEFLSGHEAVIRQTDCTRCGDCLEHCRFGAVGINGTGADDATFFIDPLACEGCGVCVRFCPVKAIDFPERHSGEWMISETRCGPMVHARLNAAAENSGKLVSIVRQEARRLAEEGGHDLVIVDGPPGIGCPVIASITGSSLVLIVTEPTLSAIHDMQRVLALAKHFNISAVVCINKYDLNADLTESIEGFCSEKGIPVVGKIPFDINVTYAQVAGQSVVEFDHGPLSKQIVAVWQNIRSYL